MACRGRPKLPLVLTGEERETLLEMASGRSAVSEDLDLGRDEFVPWQLGAVT